MPIYLTDKPTINGRVANLVTTLDATFQRIQQFQAWIQTVPDANLISAYGYVQADLDVIHSALGDLEQLRTIYQGTVNLAVAKDFRTFAKQLYPFGSV